MNAGNLLDVIGEAQDTYVQAALDTRGKTRRLVPKRGLLVAAVIALAALLVGCAVVYALRLQDLKIAETDMEIPAHFNEAGERVESTQVSGQVLTLHGLEGSSAYLAHQEWFAFLESYDPDGTLLAAAEENPVDIPEAYEAYSVYTQEMMDKVDEIAQKYDLKLLGAFAPFQRYERDVFYEALGIDSLLVPGSEAVIAQEASGYFYEGGNFSVDFTMTMPEEEGQWSYEMRNSMYYSKTDYFDRVYLTLGDLDDWEQWNYTTKNGSDVLIVQHKDGGNAWIFCAREDAVIAVRVEGECPKEDTTVRMTGEQVERIVDEIDFSLVVGDVDIDIAREKLEKFNPELSEARQAAQMETYVDPYVYDGYAAYIENLLKTPAAAESMTYALVDVNDDGVVELLLGAAGMYGDEDGCFSEVIALEDGKTRLFFATDDPLFLRASNGRSAIESVSRQEYGERHSYYTLGSDYGETQKLDDFLCVGYYAIDGTWRINRTGDVADQTVSEEEAKALMAAYESVALEMKPISQFPLD